MSVVQRAFTALVSAVMVSLWLAASGLAQANPPATPPAENAQTLQDILDRQAAQKAAQKDTRKQTSPSGPADLSAGIAGQYGTTVTPSNSQLWERLRFGTANVSTPARGAPASVVIQDGGMWWLSLRRGPVTEYGLMLLGGMLVLLALFYLIRGRIRVPGGFSGTKILRFTFIERLAHWLLAGSLVLLALTGLFQLTGRRWIIPLIGKEPFATLAHYSKWVHNNVAWAFIVGLVLVFVMWVWHNIPSKVDLVWLAKGGGLIGKGHPPARKFNAGQKLIFWAVIVLGGSVAVSGVSLLFPFEFHMFAWTFDKLNALGVPGLLGMQPFPTDLVPQEEMQFAQLWHSIVAFGLIAVILAHIYIGTIGMEGAFDAMGRGEVDLNWARQHHDLWVEEMDERDKQDEASRASPAE